MNSLNDNRRSEQPCRQRRGFSLTELIVVMAIIALLGTLIFPVVGRAVARARQTECRSNLRQFAAGLMIYRAEHRGKNPDWLSNLYPDYVDSRELYICPSDRSRGEDGGKPLDLGDGDRFEKTYDNVGRNDIDRCSYFYEFSEAEGTETDIYKWWTGTWGTDGEPERPYSWQAYKMKQRDAGHKDSNGKLGPYSDSRMPIVRCYHHWDEGKIAAQKTDGSVMDEPMTINVGYAGNVFAAPLEWEQRLDMTSADR